MTEREIEAMKDICEECEEAKSDGNNDYQIMWVDQKIINAEN